MKQFIKSKQLKITLIVLVIIAGIVMIAVKGFNFDLKYQDTKQIEFGLDKQFSISDIKAITDEVLNNEPVLIRKVEVYEDAVNITAREITDEQKANIITKVNEKYGTDLNADEIEIATVAHTKGKDIIMPYVVPFIIATIIILIYMMIKYYKLNSGKVLLKTIGIIILTQVLLFSIMAITRIPIGRLTIPLVLTVYMLTLVWYTTKLENQLKTKKQEN